MKEYTVEFTTGEKYLVKENQETHLPGRCAFTIIISNNNDASQSYTWKAQVTPNLQNHKKRQITLRTWT